jgi:hypothetical protein
LSDVAAQEPLQTAAAYPADDNQVCIGIGSGIFDRVCSTVCRRLTYLVMRINPPCLELRHLLFDLHLDLRLEDLKVMGSSAAGDQLVDVKDHEATASVTIRSGDELSTHISIA